MKSAPNKIAEVVDLPTVRTTSRGNVVAQRNKTRPNERKWTRDLAARADRWAHLVNMPAWSGYDLEYRLSKENGMGLPRIAAVFWHHDGSATLLEAKTSSSPSEVMAGVGQLLYYAAAFYAHENKKVRGLILAAPYLPPFVLAGIELSRAPVSFLKATEDGAYGLVPDFTRAEDWPGWAL